MMNRTNQRSVKRVVLALGILAASILVLMPLVKPPAQASGECPDDCQEQLTTARAATAQYHDLNKALQDGFISTFECVEVPGLGAMGVHYINPARMMDLSVDASQP